MAENKDEGTETDEWLDAASPPPLRVRIGGFLKTVVGRLNPKHVSPMYMEDYRNQPGVDTNLVKNEKGEDVVEVSVNSVVLPDNRIPKQKRKPFRWSDEP